MILHNGTIVTMDESLTIIEDGALRISDGVIQETGVSGELCARYPDDETIDVNGKLIMPGNICAHTHFYGAYARGLATHGTPPANFVEILQKLWWRLDKALSPDAVRASAQVCLIDAIKHGTTTLIDHHASPTCVDGSLDIIAETVKQSGLRACLCYEVTDRNGKAETEAGINENMRFIRKCLDNPDPLLAGTFGLHASLTLSNETLEKSVEAAGDTNCGFHIHAAEDLADQRDSLEKYQQRVIHRLNQVGVLGRKSLLAHCVHIDDSEIELLQQTGTLVTHQPRSNMNNAVGCAAVETLMDRGVTVALGNDGFSNNMWAEWKTAYLVHKLVTGNPQACQGYTVIDMAVRNTIKQMKMYWPEQSIGSLTPGSSADLILVDYTPFTPMTSGNLPWHILFGFEADVVDSTMVHGQWLMRNRTLTMLDEQAILSQAFETGREVWQHFQELR